MLFDAVVSKLRTTVKESLCIRVNNAALLYLEGAVVPLQLPAQTLQLAACQNGFAVLVPQVVFLLDQLALLLLQRPHLLLSVTVLLQL